MIIAEIVCEFIFMRFHRNRQKYRQNKVEICRLDKINNNNNFTKLV
jgi:hypothetical protein